MRPLAPLDWRAGVVAALAASVVILAGCSGEVATKAGAPASPSPAPSGAASSYQRDALAVLESLAAASTSVADSMASADPASEAWRTTVRTRLKALGDVEARAAALAPASGEQSLHQQLVSISGDVRRASDMIAAGIDPVDPDRLQQAAQLLGESVARTAALRLQLRGA